MRQGASGRNRMFDRLSDHFLTGSYDPADFALRLLHKDVSLACQLAREVQVPMRLTNMALHGTDRGFESRLGHAQLPRGVTAATGTCRHCTDRRAGGEDQGRSCGRYEVINNR